jgi:hypothetical protein
MPVILSIVVLMLTNGPTLLSQGFRSFSQSLQNIMIADLLVELEHWFRHYATRRKVMGSIPYEVIGFFNWSNLSSHTMALGSTQPQREMSTRNLPGGKGRQVRKVDDLTAVCEPIFYKIWEPWCLRTLWVSTTCYRDRFTFFSGTVETFRCSVIRPPPQLMVTLIADSCITHAVHRSLVNNKQNPFDTLWTKNWKTLPISFATYVCRIRLENLRMVIKQISY